MVTIWAVIAVVSCVLTCAMGMWYAREAEFWRARYLQERMKR